MKTDWFGSPREAAPLTREEVERFIAAGPPKPTPAVIVLSPRIIATMRRRFPEMLR